MHPLIHLPYIILGVANLMLFVYILLLMLVQFRLISPNQQSVKTLIYSLGRVFEPILKKIRQYVQPIGGLDLAPLVLFIIIYFIRYTIGYYF
jgi:YggT family protein